MLERMKMSALLGTGLQEPQERERERRGSTLFDSFKKKKNHKIKSRLTLNNYDELLQKSLLGS